MQIGYNIDGRLVSQEYRINIRGQVEEFGFQYCVESSFKLKYVTDAAHFGTYAAAQHKLTVKGVKQLLSEAIISDRALSINISSDFIDFQHLRLMIQ